MNVIGIIIGTFLSVWVGIINDILDFRILFKIHRNFLSHSPLSPVVLILFFISWFLGEILMLEDFSVVFALLLASLFEIHIFMDSFNPSGVPLIPGKIISFKKIRYNDFKVNFVISTVGILLFFGGLYSIF